MTKAKQKARAKARKQAEAQASNKAAADQVHIVVVGELETCAYTISRSDIISAGEDLPNAEKGTDELVSHIGAGLANPELLSYVRSNPDKFGVFVAAYVSRTSSFMMMESNGTNTLIFSVFKSAPPGDFQTRIASMTTLKDINRQYKSAANHAIASNPLYLKDNYHPSSVFHYLNSAKGEGL